MMGLKIRSNKREEKAEHKNNECQKRNIRYDMMWLKIRSNKREEKAEHKNNECQNATSGTA